MTKIRFKFDKEKDLRQIWSACNTPSKLKDFSRNDSNLLELLKSKLRKKGFDAG